MYGDEALPILPKTGTPVLVDGLAQGAPDCEVAFSRTAGSGQCMATETPAWCSWLRCFEPKCTATTYATTLNRTKRLNFSVS